MAASLAERVSDPAEPRLSRGTGTPPSRVGRHYAAVTATGCDYRVTNRHSQAAGRVVLAAGLSLASLAALTACSGSSASTTAQGGAGAGTAAANPVSTTTAQAAGKQVNDCTLVTAAQLSAAVGVKYTSVQASGTGTICNVTGVNVTDGFFYEVDKEDGTITTWSGELAILKEDDGSYTSVSGIGDRAAQGGVKEFAAEADGYIVVVVNADVNVATASTFTRTKKIEKLLISKL